jgi:RNA polymerase sigma-70 factor (ECF subfamily)
MHHERVTSSTSSEQELRALAERFCAGDEAAFRALYEACKQVVWRTAVLFAGRSSDADARTEAAKDISQEVWVKIWKSICTFRWESKFSSWMYKIAFRTFLDKRSAFGIQTPQTTPREMMRLELKDADGADEAQFDGMQTPDAMAHTSNLGVLLEQAMERLTPAERAVVVAKHFGGLTFAEVARELGVSDGTVKTLHFRAFKKLHAVLGAVYEEVR